MERNMLKEGVGFRELCTSRNQHGVVIDLTGTSQGAKLMLALEGMKIALRGAETALKGK
jgi:hypothetical protein